MGGTNGVWNHEKGTCKLCWFSKFETGSGWVTRNKIVNTDLIFWFRRIGVQWIKIASVGFVDWIATNSGSRMLIWRHRFWIEILEDEKQGQFFKVMFCVATKCLRWRKTSCQSSRGCASCRWFIKQVLRDLNVAVVDSNAFSVLVPVSTKSHSWAAVRGKLW